MGCALKKQLLVPSRQLITPQRRKLYRGALPGLAPLPLRVRLPVVPGSTSYGPGTYTFFLPNCDNLSIDLYAPGGGGGGSGSTFNGVPQNATPGSAGGYVRAYYYGNFSFDLIAYGGNGGPATIGQPSPLSGSHGTATGGNIANTTGGGAAGGIYGIITSSFGTGSAYGSYGGYGARCASNFSGLALYQGIPITVIVGSPGAAGANNTGGSPYLVNTQNPSGGNGGAAYISWS
jgi:hypothetical protein